MVINYPSLSEREFIEKYLRIYNLLMPEEQQLVESEILLIIEFCLLPDEKFAYQRFGSLAKTKVIEAALNSDWKLTKLNINNKLYALIDKKFLRRDEDRVIYLPKHLIEALKDFRSTKKFELKVNFNARSSQNK